MVNSTVCDCQAFVKPPALAVRASELTVRQVTWSCDACEDEAQQLDRLQSLRGVLEW